MNRWWKLDILKVDLKKIAYSSFNNYNFLRELNLSHPEYEALKKLSDCKDIVIHKSDNGNWRRNRRSCRLSSKIEKLRVKPGKDYNLITKEKKEVDAMRRKCQNPTSVPCVSKPVFSRARLQKVRLFLICIYKGLYGLGLETDSWIWLFESQYQLKRWPVNEYWKGDSYWYSSK